MSDDLPTEEQLLRIERGVQRRIDARRATAQRVARGVSGAAVAVLVIAGGFALLRPLGGGAASTSSAGGSEASASAMVRVVCDEGGTPTAVQADRARLPASALQACVGVRDAAQPAAASGSSTSSTPPASVLCRAEDGALHVYPGTTAVCGAHGMRAYAG